MDLVFYVFLIYILAIISIFWFQARRKKEIREQVFGLVNSTLELTPEEFIEMRNKSFGGRGTPKYTNNYNFAGVYILHNKTKELYYVGQGKQVLNRVNSHFTGKGNGDVYADYKYGDYWTIKMIALNNSGFNTLNALERHTIETYDSYKSGYNKTRGNR